MLRTLASRGATCAIDGAIAGLDARLDDGWFEVEGDEPWSTGVIFIERIEPEPTSESATSALTRRRRW